MRHLPSESSYLVIVKIAQEHSYHHGNLRRALLDAAVAEVAAMGASGVSLREIARRAGVSHAAPAHHFGDKTGIFTAIAIEGYERLVERTAPLAALDDALLQTGVVYIRFAIENPGYFEVMFSPELHHRDDPDLVRARDASFAVLYDCARRGAHLDDTADVTPLVVASWAVVHGLAQLWLTSNLRDYVGDDLDAAIVPITAGFVALGHIIEEQVGS